METNNTGYPIWMSGSLAMRLSEPLQPIQAGFFMSYFHRPTVNVPEVRPGWQGEGDAVCNAPADLVVSSMMPADKNEVKAKILLLQHILPANASFPSLISCLHPLTTPLSVQPSSLTP